MRDTHRNRITRLSRRVAATAGVVVPVLDRIARPSRQVKRAVATKRQVDGVKARSSTPGELRELMRSEATTWERLAKANPSHEPKYTTK